MPKGIWSDETLLKKYPGLTLEEAKAARYEWLMDNASKAGSWRGDKGFAKNPALASLAGKKGRKIRKEEL